MKAKLFLIFMLIILVDYTCAKHFQKNNIKNEHKYLITDQDCVNKCLAIDNATNCGKFIVGCCFACIKTFFSEWCVDQRIELNC